MTDVLVREAPAARTWQGSVADRLVLVPAPSTGRFRPTVTVGDQTGSGQLLGHVTGGAGRADAVHAPVDGDVRGVLVRPGQLVTRGQAIAWLERGALTVEVGR